MRVFLTEWNSSELVKEITSKGKKKGRLTPTTFCLLHATDFADRYERNIFPLIHAGYIVLADRYGTFSTTTSAAHMDITTNSITAHYAGDTTHMSSNSPSKVITFCYMASKCPGVS